MTNKLSLTETEAAEVSGVSIRTLHKFAEAGYLQIQTASDFTIRFSSDELVRVFGVNPSLANSDTTGEEFSESFADPRAEQVIGAESVQASNKEVNEPTSFDYVKVIELLEKEVVTLRSENEWLKKRLEWFEDKSERDQMVLISETQMLHRLVAQQQRSKSLTQHLLEWLGVEQPKNQLRLIDGKASSVTKIDKAVGS